MASTQTTPVFNSNPYPVAQLVQRAEAKAVDLFSQWSFGLGWLDYFCTQLVNGFNGLSSSNGNLASEAGYASNYANGINADDLVSGFATVAGRGQDTFVGNWVVFDFHTPPDPHPGDYLMGVIRSEALTEIDELHDALAPWQDIPIPDDIGNTDTSVNIPPHYNEFQ